MTLDEVGHGVLAMKFFDVPIGDETGVIQNAFVFSFLLVEDTVFQLIRVDGCCFILFAECSAFVVEARTHDVFCNVVCHCTRDIAHADVNEVARDPLEYEIKIDDHELICGALIDEQVGHSLWLKVAHDLTGDQEDEREHGDKSKRVAVPAVGVPLIFKPLELVQVEELQHFLKRHLCRSTALR